MKPRPSANIRAVRRARLRRAKLARVVTFGSYGGWRMVSPNREDLLDMIVNIDPFDTPFLPRYWPEVPVPRVDWLLGTRDLSREVPALGFGLIQRGADPQLGNFSIANAIRSATITTVAV